MTKLTVVAAALPLLAMSARAQKIRKELAMQPVALRKLRSPSQDGQCAGTSDATGNACWS